MENKDPILAALARIEAKQDDLLKNQLQQIRKDVKRTAAVYGGLGGVIVSTFWELLRAKLGV